MYRKPLYSGSKVFHLNSEHNPPVLDSVILLALFPFIEMSTHVTILGHCEGQWLCTCPYRNISHLIVGRLLPG